MAPTERVKASYRLCKRTDGRGGTEAPRDAEWTFQPLINKHQSLCRSLLQAIFKASHDSLASPKRQLYIIDHLGLRFFEDVDERNVTAIVFGGFNGAYVAFLTPMIALLAEHSIEMGTRAGIRLFLIGLGCLLVPPIGGALLTSRFTWWNPIVFGGVSSGDIIDDSLGDFEAHHDQAGGTSGPSALNVTIRLGEGRGICVNEWHLGADASPVGVVCYPRAF